MMNPVKRITIRPGWGEAPRGQAVWHRPAWHQAEMPAPRNAARGIIHGVGISVLIWACVAMAVWAAT